MQKKLMAIAVAGALGAPAVALAQASTVQIYGQITYEYGIGFQGDAAPGVGRPNVDYADTPGGSAIGFRGEEKLGGGMSAWFQCETSADIRGYDQIGLCSRNSAVGFKGGFGNIHFGRWDTPMKRALNVGTVGAEETGLLGMSFLPFGGSGGADATGTSQATSVGVETQQRARWKRREAGLSYYESPRFGGFQLLAAFSPGNAAADNGAINGDTNDKPRVWSFGGIYEAGPLGIGLGYERHNDFGAFTGPANLDDRAWGASISYKFGPVEVGATYLDAKYETTATTELKKRTATIGVDWTIAGPHSIEAQYGWAGDSKGNSLVGVGGGRGHAASGSDTGGDQISIAYRYRFSKRTSIKLGYVQVDNDANTTTYRVGNTASVTAGEKSSAVAFHIRHRF
jgi:predicted porin